jgi:hypothetical protein
MRRLFASLATCTVLGACATAEPPVEIVITPEHGRVTAPAYGHNEGTELTGKPTKPPRTLAVPTPAN